MSRISWFWAGAVYLSAMVAPAELALYSGAAAQDLQFIDRNPAIDAFRESERFDLEQQLLRQAVPQPAQRPNARAADAAWAGVQAATARCRATYPFNKPSVVSLAKCLNVAEQPILAYERDPDLWRLNHATRLSVAEKVVLGKITAVEGARQWAFALSQLVSEEERREAARRSGR